MNTGREPLHSRQPPAHDHRLAARRAPTTRSKAPCSSAAPSCSGCATGSASSSGRRTSRRSRPACPTPAASTSCRPSPGSAARTGTPYARGTIVGIVARHDAGAPRPRRARGDRVPERRGARRDAAGRRASRCVELRVDGGATANDLLMQFQADLLGVPVVRPHVTETTALGAAYLAGLAVGFWALRRDEVASRWKVDRRFEPAMSRDEAAGRIRQWSRAVERARDWHVRGLRPRAWARPSRSRRPSFFAADRARVLRGPAHAAAAATGCNDAREQPEPRHHEPGHRPLHARCSRSASTSGPSSPFALWQLPADGWWVWVARLVALRLLLLLEAPRRPRCARVLGRARRAPPEPGLQPLDRPAPDLQRRAARLDLLPADGDRRLSAAGVRGRRARRPALPVLDPHRAVGKLGWFDRWFASPSNHRVHHAVNDRYLDRNYGGILIIWDRLFGSFVEETRALRLRHARAARSWDPLWANLEVYADLARKSLARRPLARQAPRLVQAARLAACDRVRRALAEDAFDLARCAATTRR